MSGLQPKCGNRHEGDRQAWQAGVGGVSTIQNEDSVGRAKPGGAGRRDTPATNSVKNNLSRCRADGDSDMKGCRRLKVVISVAW